MKSASAPSRQPAMAPAEPMGPDRAGERSMPADLKEIWRTIRGDWIALLAVALCLILASAAQPAVVAVIKYTVDWGKAPMPRWVSYPMLPAAVLLMFAVQGAAMAVSTHLMGRISADLISAIQRRLHRQVLDSQAGPTPRPSIGRVMHLLTFEIKQCADLLDRVTGKLIRHSLSLLALYASLLVLNWKLTLIASLAVPIVFAVCKAVFGRVRLLTRRQIAANESMANLLAERSRKANVVKLHGAVELELRQFQVAADHLRAAQLKFYCASAMPAPLSQVLAVAVIGIILACTLQAVNAGAMTKGSAAAYVTNLFLILAPLKNLAELAGPILRSILGAQSVLALEGPPAAHRRPPEPPSRGDVALRRVTARYLGQRRAALDNVDLAARPGEIVAITGPSGAGKSSLFEVLRARLKPDSGDVLVDGRPLRELTPEELSRHLAVVTQHARLFDRSILENVAYGDERPDRERVWEVLAQTRLDQLVRALPQGLESRVGVDGRRLSGGQVRLLTIARALYTRAPVLLMDEPTASLDADNERSLCEVIARLRGRRTVLLITHSQTLAAVADRVVAMRLGGVVASQVAAARSAAT